MRAAAQGEFDALVCLALDHPGPRAKVLAILIEVLTHLGLAGGTPKSPRKPARKPNKRRARR